jgi:CheY-like chemotaxis protein
MLKPILLVEDDPSDLELTLAALAKSQLVNEVIVARDDQEAIDYLRCEGDGRTRNPGNPAVILLDLKLPKIDGLEVLETIRSSDTLKSIAVVMLTSSREEQDLARSYALGVNAYVVKPVEVNEFVEAIADLGVFWAALNEPPPGSTRVRRQPASE